VRNVSWYKANMQSGSINLSIPFKPKRAVTVERKFTGWIYGLAEVACALHKYSGKYVRYAKPGRINEIISAAESSAGKARWAWKRLVFIRRLDRHKFSTIGLAIFPAVWNVYICGTSRSKAQRDPGPLTRPGRGHGDPFAKVSHGLAISGKIYRPERGLSKFHQA